MLLCESCDTFVAMSDVTSGGEVIFGKNSDRPRGEVQEVVAFSRKTYPPGQELQCTYITIPQSETTNGVVLSKPAWMWGAEIGANEFGVAVGNEAVFDKLTDFDFDIQPRLLGMDLLRLGLERGKTAEEVLNVIVELLEKYGQGGSCSDIVPNTFYHNSFLIVDNKEAWVLETAQKFWVAQKITSGVRNISNCMSIGSEIDRMSEGLKEKCLKEGWWNPEKEFNWREVIGDEDDGFCSQPNSRFNCGAKLLDQLSKQKRFDMRSMMSILQHEESNISRPYYTKNKNASLNPTTGSQISVLGKSAEQTVHWFTATPDPKISVYKPFRFGENGIAQTSILTTSPVSFPTTVQYPHERSHTLWSHHQLLASGASRSEVIMKMDPIQNELIASLASGETKTDGENLNFHRSVQLEMANTHQ